MRVLMRDSQDNSLIAFDAQEVIVDKIAQVNADAYIRELVDLGKVDLTMYGAKASN